MELPKTESPEQDRMLWKWILIFFFSGCSVGCSSKTPEFNYDKTARYRRQLALLETIHTSWADMCEERGKALRAGDIERSRILKSHIVLLTCEYDRTHEQFRQLLQEKDVPRFFESTSAVVYMGDKVIYKGEEARLYRESCVDWNIYFRLSHPLPLLE